MAAAGPAAAVSQSRSVSSASVYHESPLAASEASKLFAALGMDEMPRSENLVCTPCSRTLAPYLPFKLTLDTDNCKLCAYRQVKPEAFTQPFCEFMTENPTVFHAVDHFKTQLGAVGYKEVRFPPSYMTRYKV
jgi:aminopeptidase I